MNLVTPKAGAKHELLFNKPASVAFHWQHQGDQTSHFFTIGLLSKAHCDFLKDKVAKKLAAFLATFCWRNICLK
jgi:hypothetical protein